jgi:hypothetical protein
LLERRDQWLRNAIGSPTGLTVAGQIDPQIPVTELQSSITDETVALRNQAPGLLFPTRAFEVFVDGRRDGIVRRRDLA